MNPDGSGLTRLTKSTGTDFTSFSPDAAKIAFSSDRPPAGPDRDLHDECRRFGARPVQLTAATGDDFHPDWQPIPVNCGGKTATLVGTAANDTMSGTAGADVLAGLGGKDNLKGLGGKDILCGGKGKDTLVGGGGKDRLLGQAGKDKMKGGKGRDFCKGGKGNDTAKGCEQGKP